MTAVDRRLKVDVNYKKIAESGPLFSDSLFPATTASLGYDDDMTQIVKKGAKWKRVPEVYKSYKLFKGIDIDDVVQGELGDCYYISAITAISETPSRVTKLFLINKENKYGCYAVALYICGSLRTIIVDDFFPAFDRSWALTHSREEEIWVMVLEKAWAKAHGDYAITSGGDARESLSSLTGAPATLVRHNTTTRDELWKILIEATRKKYAMCTGGAQQTRGLHTGHAYTLLKAIELNTKNSGLAKLVQIRNPWGEYEWTGDWSDNCGNWTNDLRVQAGHVKKDDGTFFMHINDFYNLYSYIFVCQCVDSYIRTEVTMNEYEACVVFQLASETKGFFSAHQMTPRMTKAKAVKPLFVELYAFRDQKLQLVKPNPPEIKVLDFTKNPGGCNALGVATIEAILPAGLYIMHGFFLNNDTPSIRYLCFSAYASKVVDLIHLKGKNNPKNITKADLTNAVKDYVKTNDITPPEKQPAKGTAQTCPESHQVKFDTTKTEAFRCDLCKDSRSGGRYRCTQCSYDVCTTCRAAPAGTTAPKKEPEKKEPEKKEPEKKPPQSKAMPTTPVAKYVPPTTPKSTCSRGHTLQLKSISAMLNRLFICGSCSDVVRFSGSRWVCESCSYYLCEKCRDPKNTSGSSSTSTTYKYTETIKTTIIISPKCTKNHTLKYDYTIYPDNSYLCDRCDREGKCTSGRWRCATCNFDICTVCSPAPSSEKFVVYYEKAGKESAPVSSTIITTCLSDHLLWYSTYSYLSGQYECNKCFKLKNCADGRWFCLQCEYDICLECRAAPEDVEKYMKICCNGHNMIQSRNRYTPEEIFYRCNFCRKARDVESNRWWCPICSFDICLECAELDIENEDWPDPVDKEERWCKEKHKFIKSKAKENFTCEKDEEEYHDDDSYTCLNCGMTQCKKCAASSGVIVPDVTDDPNCPGEVSNEYRNIKATLGDEAKLPEGDTSSSAIDEPVREVSSEEVKVKVSVEIPKTQPISTKREEAKQSSYIKHSEVKKEQKAVSHRSAPGGPNLQDEPSPPSKPQERPSDCGCLIF